MLLNLWAVLIAFAVVVSTTAWSPRWRQLKKRFWQNKRPEISGLLALLPDSLIAKVSQHAYTANLPSLLNLCRTCNFVFESTTHTNTHEHVGAVRRVGQGHTCFLRVRLVTPGLTPCPST